MLLAQYFWHFLYAKTPLGKHSIDELKLLMYVLVIFSISCNYLQGWYRTWKVLPF